MKTKLIMVRQPILSAILFISIFFFQSCTNYYNQGTVNLTRGQLDEAIDDFSRAIARHPMDADAYYNRGIAYGKKGRYDRAISDYTKAIELNPLATDAYYNRGNAHNINGQYDMAISDYTKVMSLNPKDAGPINNLAWLYATCSDQKFRDGTKAVELALTALEIKPISLFYLDTLAAAYAEAGRFDEAVDTQTAVINLSKYDDIAEHIPAFKERLKLYKLKKAYREKVQARNDDTKLKEQ